MLALTLALIALVVLPAFIRSSVSLEIGRCWALQRHLLAALDAYEADTSEKLTDLQTALPLLVEHGYLSQPPVDPGDERPASIMHFGRNAHGAVYCWVHGSPWPDGKRPALGPGRPPWRYGPTWPPPPPPPDKRIVIKKIPGFYR